MTLQFDAVTFAYGRFRSPVLREFTWLVPPGKTVLLGPNGAGKSTLLALGANALQPRAGRVRYGELDGARRRDRAAYRKAIGWMPQQVKPVPGLTAREQVTYAGWLKGLSYRTARVETERALAQTQLAALAHRDSATLSGGELRRLGIAQALSHEAQVLLLDEPTASLDPSQRARFRELIAAIPAVRTVVVSTHQIDDLSDLFDTVVVLDRGQIHFSGSVPAFLALAGGGADLRSAELAYTRAIGRAT